MNLKFYLNDDIDMTKIKDSMMLDSGQVIASLSDDESYATLEVRGDVKIWWNENGDPFDGQYYKYPSEFPEKLKKLISDGVTSDNLHWTLDPRLYISENNWFEVFYGNAGYPDVPSAEVVDCEQMSATEIFNLLYEFMEGSK